VTAPAVTSRRISAGIRPDPGTTSRLPSWWSADDWLTEVADALTDDVLREHRIAGDTVLAVARGHAAFADYRTGRGCRPTNERLVEVTRVSLSTVHRARRVLKRLGLVVELVRGRSIMTRAERIAAWRRGSSHRQVAAEFALCSRRRRAPKMSTPKVREPGNDLGARPQSVDGDTPPGAKIVTRFSHLRSTHLRRQTEKSEEAPLRGTAPKGTDRRAGGAHPSTRRLAEAVQRRTGWLSGVSVRRITPTLSRFARAGWTPRDVELAVRDALAARGWRVPRTLKAPAAYLAMLLRPLDVEDRPSVLEDAYAAAAAAAAAEKRATQRRWHAALRTTCAHGVPAGDVPHPLSGSVVCLDCRRT
jgi:hypothetical protein